ncbi:hypothetical protein ACFFX0_10725 [Citricoccus parietis]|uniref:Uncharacterized protein n=1 Tax=Citricoccus parietis TaxID=592307 RepID=A0ABV5FY76_9MICC
MGKTKPRGPGSTKGTGPRGSVGRRTPGDRPASCAGLLLRYCMPGETAAAVPPTRGSVKISASRTARPCGPS